jgi:hypothetical protein
MALKGSRIDLHEARAKVAYTSKFFQGARETLRLK